MGVDTVENWKSLRNLGLFLCTQDCEYRVNSTARNCGQPERSIVAVENLRLFHRKSIVYPRAIHRFSTLFVATIFSIQVRARQEIVFAAFVG